MMTTENLGKLKRSLVKHEGCEKFPYQDTVGKITIGIGYNLSDRGLPDEWINKQYEEDVSFFYQQLSANFPWFNQLNNDRQVVLIDMAFMGLKRFCGFKKMLDALQDHDYDQAADEMLASRWAEQAKGRAIELSNAMRTGAYTV